MVPQRSGGAARAGHRCVQRSSIPEVDDMVDALSRSRLQRQRSLLQEQVRANRVVSLCSVLLVYV